ncbi:MAG TPA: hypothetical protein PLV45_11370 [bacterium]|nr:hypothetical protein [bacterium]
MRKTLRDIAQKLNRDDHPWLLAGKTAAVLQGALIQAHKITLYSDQLTAYRFNTTFEAYRSLKVKYRTESALAGHAGTFDMHGVEVSIVGDPEIMYQGRHLFIPLQQLIQDARVFDLDGVTIPLLPPAWLILLGIIGGDNDLAKSMVASGVTRDEVMKNAQMMGIAVNITPMMDAIF